MEAELATQCMYWIRTCQNMAGSGLTTNNTIGLAFIAFQEDRNVEYKETELGTNKSILHFVHERKYKHNIFSFY